MAMTWYGNYDTVAIFPPASKTYNRIWMHYTLGCPTSGCSAWDYTTQIFLMKKTGAMDSTLRLIPNFTVNGNTIDTFIYSNTPTIQTLFNNNTGKTDSIAADSFLVRVFADTLFPFTQTDSFIAWKANFFNYIFDNSGTKIDSFWIAATDTKYVYKTHYYEKFPVLEPFELGRVITPYGGSYPKSWTNEYRFDITDFAPLLHDTVQLRAFYSGWSSGFTVTLHFDMIEGTPARDIKEVINLYNGDFPYGNSNNPIENYLTQKNIQLHGATQAKLRFTPTGHGFGADNTDNCAEFCNKSYDVIMNNQLIASNNIWRDDCGMNPLMHQSGTWLYDRANWCPGAKGLTHEFELTPHLSGNSFQLQVLPEPFEDLDPAGLNPSYTISSQIITYGSWNFNLDISLEDVIAPNAHDAYRRFNPICAAPKVIIKNNGISTLNSLRFYYGIEGKELFFYDWHGSLSTNQTETVSLPYRVISDSSHNIFKVWLTNPNNKSNDDYMWNDTLRVHTLIPPKYEPEFNFILKTNADYQETSWFIKDDENNLWYENETLQANKIYTTPVSLIEGCYQFVLNDSGKDGLSFFANNSGNGYARFTTTSNSIFKVFEPDFGTQISQQFIVGDPYIFVPSKVEEIKLIKSLRTFPNPTKDIFTVELTLETSRKVNIELKDNLGTSVKTVFAGEGKNFVLPVEVAKLSSGIYHLIVSGTDFMEVKKVIVIH